MRPRGTREQLLALVDGRRARDLRCVQRLGQHVDLVEVLADDEDLLSRVPRDESFTTPIFACAVAARR
jgi:hypothetical protein